MITIISITGRDFDSCKFRNRDDNPNFYKTIEEIFLLDDIRWGDTKFSCIASGESEWIR